MKAWTGQRGQKIFFGTRILGKANWNRTAETGQPDRTARRGQLEKGSQDFTGRTRKRGQDVRIMTGRTVQLGQGNGDEQPCHDSKNITAGRGKLGTRVLEQDKWAWTAATGQLGQDSWDRTARTG